MATGSCVTLRGVVRGWVADGPVKLQEDCVAGAVKGIGVGRVADGSESLVSGKSSWAGSHKTLAGFLWGVRYFVRCDLGFGWYV